MGEPGGRRDAPVGIRGQLAEPVHGHRAGDVREGAGQSQSLLRSAVSQSPSDRAIDLLGKPVPFREHAEGARGVAVVVTLDDEAGQYRDRCRVSASAGGEGGAAVHQRVVVWERLCERGSRADGC